MFGGKIVRNSRKVVPGTYRQHAYQDTWQDSMDIEFAGDLNDPAVQEAIKQAFYKSQSCQQAESSYGRLRWNSGDSVNRIDVAQKQLVIDCGCSLCD